MGKVQSRELAGAPTITFDLIALLHNNFDSAKIKAFTPIVKNKSFLLEAGQRIIESIIKRTLSGVDKSGNAFKGYSEAYTKSSIYKIYKGRSRKVNLKLTGDMQADLGVITHANGQVTVGFTDLTESEKAKGHITGANYLPRRDFFGLPNDEVVKITVSTIKDFIENEPFELFEDEAGINIQVDDQDLEF